jgi:hypothetical protein
LSVDLCQTFWLAMLRRKTTNITVEKLVRIHAAVLAAEPSRSVLKKLSPKKVSVSSATIANLRQNRKRINPPLSCWLVGVWVGSTPLGVGLQAELGHQQVVRMRRINGAFDLQAFRRQYLCDLR